MSPTPDTVPPPHGLSPLEAGDPATIGPYRVVGRIGAGGMGAVFGALDGQGVCVAVKTVHADFAGRPRFREAFAREVEMLGRADGISTARLHAADTEATVPWLAFDYVAGRDLRRHVRAFGPLEGDMLRTFALGTAEGLAALHAAGIAHRDIKPGNVILSPGGPKIVDFGIAVDIGTDRTTDASASYGTPGWSAPERYTGVSADPAADVFAWGGLVTLAASRRAPFGTGDAGELARRVRQGEYDVTGVPEELRGLVEAALSVDPLRRPTSEELVRALLPEAEPDGRTGGGAVTDGLRRMLRDYWRGVDDAGHDPGRWAAALGAVSAAGLGASVVGGGALGTGGSAGTGAAGAGTGAGGSVGAGTATASASAGSGTTGGLLSAVATSKAGLAAAGVLAVAAVAAGGYVVYEQVVGGPSERVAAAASLLEEGPGFTARVTRSYTRAHAERVEEETGQPVEAVLEESRAEEEYLYSAADQSFLIRGAAMGPDTTAVASHQGELYVYAPREAAPGLWEDSPQQLSVTSEGVSLSFGEEGDHGLWRPSAEPHGLGSDVSPDSVAATLVTAGLRALADTGGAEAVKGEDRVYEGATVLPLLVEGELVEEDAIGRTELDAEGAPVWAEYGSDRWDVRFDFQDVDVDTPMEDPQVWAAENDGFGWEVVHAPVCGSVGLPEWADEWDAAKVWDVQASGWGVDCDDAMDLAELREDSSLSPDRSEMLHGSRGTRSGIWQYDDSMTCGIYWNEYVRPESYPAPSYEYGPCQESAVLSRDDSDPLNRLSEVDFGPVTLIDFHERA
ncbi:protein kinase [Nocardiopsis sp. NPDC058789]|uniref:serine/threonine-protein kinase n=1 Tax=Nocardiopsis sp. NPDC058789 TaxID=3346634 RepID=UPI00366A8231